MMKRTNVRNSILRKGKAYNKIKWLKHGLNIKVMTSEKK